MRLLFSRHGESEANIQAIISNRDLDHPLTAKGRTQAQRLALLMADYKVRKIYCSPIPRARETAKIAASHLGLPFHVEAALREIDCGMMEGRGDATAWAMHDAVIKAWDEERDYGRFIPPDGESFADVRARFLPFIDRLTRENGEDSADILLISHGSLLLQMLPLVLSDVTRTFTKEHPIGNCQPIITEYRDGELICVHWP